MQAASFISHPGRRMRSLMDGEHHWPGAPSIVALTRDAASQWPGVRCAYDSGRALPGQLAGKTKTGPSTCQAGFAIRSLPPRRPSTGGSSTHPCSVLGRARNGAPWLLPHRLSRIAHPVNVSTSRLACRCQLACRAAPTSFASSLAAPSGPCVGDPPMVVEGPRSAAGDGAGANTHEFAVALLTPLE